jgi:gliding motility-associated-like protein
LGTGNTFTTPIINSNTSYYVGLCPSTFRKIINVTTSPGVTASNAGINQQVCQNSATLAANIPTIGTGIWTVISGAGSIANPNLFNTTVSNLSLGSNVFEWTISAPGCLPSQSQVTITLVAAPTADAGVNQQLCANNALLAASGSGTWSIAAGSGNFSSVTDPNATVTNLSVGLNTLIWTVTAPGCPAAQDTVDIVVSAAVSIADAGNNQQLCSDSTNLNALAPIVGNGTWTLITGSGSFVDVNSNASAVNGLSLGVNVFEWTVSAPGCPSTTDQVTITVDAILPIANAGIDQTLCATTTLLTANAAPAGATGTWSVISGSPSFNNINNNNTAVSNLSVGVNTLIWTIQNPLCPAVTDTMLITVANSLSIADAGANQQICSSSTNLNAVVPAIGIGTWTVVSGSAVIADPSLNNSLVTGLGAGTTVLEWTISGAGCPSNASQISITVNLLNDIANAGTDAAICGNTSNLNANVASAGITGTWSSPQSGIAFLNVNDQNTAVNNLQNGANTLIWTFTNSVGCPPSSDTIIINSVNNPSQANAGTDKTICADNASLSATAPAIGSGLWSIFSGTGNITNASSPNTSVNNLLPGNIILVWTVANAPCTANSDTVTITVFAALSPAIAGADASLCDNQYNMNATAPTSGTGTWTLISGNGTISNINAANTGISNLGVGINTFQWTVANGICPDLTDQISITVAEPGSIAAAGGDIQTCTQNTQLNATTPLIGNGAWTVTQGNASISNPSNPNTNVTILSPGGATFSWQVTSGSCPASSDDLNVVLLNGSDAANAGEDVTIAIGDSTTLNGSGGTINGWDPPRGLSCIDCPNPIANPDTTTMYYLSVTDINGCTSIDSVLITVDETIGWYLPNAFTPDDNGVNDVLYFYGTSVKEFILQVFDRWGEKVFETTDFKVGWDGSYKGKPALAGVYTYQLTITFKSTVVEQVKGNLNLIRN